MSKRSLLRLGGLVAAAALVAGSSAAAAREGAVSDVAIEIVGPGAAEMSAWSDLRLSVQNLQAEPVRVHLTVTAPTASTRPAAATGATCLQASQAPAPVVVECELPLDEAATGSVAIPVQWNGPGMRTVDVQARAVAPSSTAPDASATLRVSVYTLVLRHLETSPSPIRAGRPFRAVALLARSDTLQPLSPHSLRCPAVTAPVPRGRVLSILTGRGTRRGAHLTCSWRVPLAAKGRFVRALVLADTHSGGMQTKYPFVRVVR
jgi:hypothetical protein